ncbi:hypothetical protein F3Y22_tig00002919pilonHSYRG00171 [Hibiscus syriacus]|uniref:Trichome birefringence-like N-terminal domain-containing protein n=1 Tax=Hibiscus syriacus TaxID=106335 RepID=A0A6A3CPL2_HIBSY|nr:hypothetical protein F3Y22_tig00002919pilonHSYRG00171 [Hibiscus syriacus]
MVDQKTPHCPFIHSGFRCLENGRPDSFYTKWRCKPKLAICPGLLNLSFPSCYVHLISFLVADERDKEKVHCS